jgi:O-acetylhomoserine/O-acetylserine sulfhydrylase
VFLKKFGIGVKWVKTDDPEEFRKEIDERTKALYIESIGNPKYNVPNIAEIAKVGPLKIRLPLSRLTATV